MKLLMALLLAFISTLSFAADRNAAYELICKPLTFESERLNCLNQIRNFNYFDDRALRFCSARTFNSEKMGCTLKIAQRMYEDFEYNYCMSLTFENQQIECLRTSGTVLRPNPNPTCLDKYTTMSSIQAAINLLRMGNPQAADATLNNLLVRISACPN
jgi:hypothetical protein